MVFNLNSLLPSRNNAHLSDSTSSNAHLSDATSNNAHLSDASSLPPTWFYNSAILEDVLAGHYSSFILQQAKDAPNTLLAGNLIRVGDDSIPHP